MKVRFAPSPTGNLHIGSVRTALFNWVFAKRYNANLVLRIEDTDQERSKKEYEDNILEGLSWLGISMDEGPGEGGGNGPYRQSERIKEGVYQKQVDQLIAEKKAYYCFETPEELEAERKAAESEGVPYVYSRKSLLLSDADVQKKLDQKIPYTVRFKMPDQGDVVVKDLIRGDVSFDLSLIGDFIILKSDGSAAYNFAVVVDDIDMEISHVIRGEDHLSNTPKQIVLFEAFGKGVPEFAHLPIILGKDRSKLSKRHGAQAVIDYRAEGFLPEALINYLSLLGWAPPGEQEILSKEELVSLFDIERVSKSGAVFDMNKLIWMNGQYIRKYDKFTLFQKVEPYLSEALQEALSTMAQEIKEDMVVSVQDNLDKLSDINRYLGVYAMDFNQFKGKIESVGFSNSDKVVIKALDEWVGGAQVWERSQVLEMISGIQDQTGLGKGRVMKPIRLCTTGEQSGPNLSDLLCIIGKEVIQERVSFVLQSLEG